MKYFINNNKIMLTLLAVLLLACISVGGMYTVSAEECLEYEKSFISIEITEGDTLTSIATQYAPAPSAYDSYVEEVKTMNNLTSDTIHSGCYLLIPCYSRVE